MKQITVSRYHDFSCGHRVVGHEGKCRNLHGHNYRVTFTAAAQLLDDVGRVIDFSVLKTALCDWVEQYWDHRMLIWDQDPWKNDLLAIDQTVVLLPFNPTAENLADFLLESVGPYQLPEHIKLVSVRMEETRKCSAEAQMC